MIWRTKSILLFLATVPTAAQIFSGQELPWHKGALSAGFEQASAAAGTPPDVEPIIVNRPLVDMRFDSNLTYELSGSVPAFPNGAAGPQSLIAVVNSHIEARNKTGTILWGPETLEDLFVSLSPGGSIFRVKILYDTHESRFVILANDSDGATYSSILLAVSQQDNPMGIGAMDWYFHKMNSTIEDNWASFPGLAFDEEALYITQDMLPLNGTNATKITPRLWIVEKAQFYSGASANAKLLVPPAVNVNELSVPALESVVHVPLEPAVIRSAAGAGPGVGTYLVGLAEYAYNPVVADIRFHDVIVMSVNDPLGNTTFAMGVVRLGDSTTLTANQPPMIAVGENRISNVVWQDNVLYWAHMFDPSVTGGAPFVSTLPLTFSTLDFSSSGTNQFQGFSPVFLFERYSTVHPSVAVNSQNVMAVGVSAAPGPTEYAGAYIAAVDFPNNEFRGPEVVREGVAPYTREAVSGFSPWGQYSSVSLDPSDDECFWAFNMYAAPQCLVNTTGPGEDGCWGTAWARMCAVVMSSSPSSIPSTQPSISSPPSVFPSSAPSNPPTLEPSNFPSLEPTNLPSLEPTNLPSLEPTNLPSLEPTNLPSLKPTNLPSLKPTNLPSLEPTNLPSLEPTNLPSLEPTNLPSLEPTNLPSLKPTNLPSLEPSNPPTSKPSQSPSRDPSSMPFSYPSFIPSILPTTEPSDQPEGNTADTSYLFGPVNVELSPDQEIVVELACRNALGHLLDAFLFCDLKDQELVNVTNDAGDVETFVNVTMCVFAETGENSTLDSPFSLGQAIETALNENKTAFLEELKSVAAKEGESSFFMTVTTLQTVLSLETTSAPTAVPVSGSSQSGSSSQIPDAKTSVVSSVLVGAATVAGIAALVAVGVALVGADD